MCLTKSLLCEIWLVVIKRVTNYSKVRSSGIEQLRAKQSNQTLVNAFYSVSAFKMAMLAVSSACQN